MKSYLVHFLFLVCAAINAQDVKQEALNTFLKTSGFNNNLTSVAIKDFNGRDVIAYNQNTPLTPASTLKVLTTATALELLGPEFTFKTYLGKGEANELVIKGTGDPTLGTIYNNSGVKMNFSYQASFLDDWLSKINQSFSDKTQPLKIFIDDMCYGYQGVSSNWIFEDIGNYYGAGVYGLNVFDNSYTLTLNTENPNQAPKIVSTFPTMRSLTFTNLLTYNTTGRDNAYITGSPFSNHLTLIGNVPSGRSRFSIKGAIPDPAAFLGTFIKTKMENGNYTISSVTTAKDYYLKHRFAGDTISMIPFYTHESIPLSKICKITNVVSNNLFAESLIRKIGAIDQKTPYNDPLGLGIEKTSSFWEARGLNRNELFLFDGCGLSPSDAISADFLTSLLVYMQTKSKNATAFLESFPKAGQEGTVKNVLSQSKHKGSVYMKSGSINGVQSYAGYYIKGDKKFAFSVIVNKYSCTRGQVVKAIEKLLETIFE